MKSVAIITVSILLAVIYGIVHDLITANMSIEYFTIGHPKIIESEAPLQLALAWGVAATWWAGLVIGVLMSIAALIGKKPKAELVDVFKHMLYVFFSMALIATLSGTIGYIMATHEVFRLTPVLAEQIAPERHHLFLAVGWSHGASYLTGFIGGIVVCIKIWMKRSG